MIQKLCRRILEGCMGYSVNVDQQHPEKYVIALAPHTSNWDFIIGILYSRAYGIKSQFMIKKSWFFWPMCYVMRSLGGIPVERSKKMSLTDQLAEAAKNSKHFSLCITPEGTRKQVMEWKKGFYYIALKAGIPILLYKIDYEKKVIECSKTINPNGEFETQMTEIKEYYKECKGKHPEKFSL